MDALKAAHQNDLSTHYLLTWALFPALRLEISLL